MTPDLPEPKMRAVSADLTLAKRSCRHCYGTGIQGTLLKNGERYRILCRCVEKATREQVKQAARAAASALAAGAPERLPVCPVPGASQGPVEDAKP